MHKGKLSFRYEFTDTPSFVKVKYTVPMRNDSDGDFTKHTFKKAGMVRPKNFKRCVPPTESVMDFSMLDMEDCDISGLYEYVCGDSESDISNPIVDSVVSDVLHNCHEETTKSYFSGLDFLMNADLDELSESIIGDTKHVLYGNDDICDNNGNGESESEIDLDLCMDLTLGDTKNDLYPNASMAWMDSFDDPWMDPWMLNKP